MSITLEEAIEKMQATGDWSFDEDSLLVLIRILQTMRPKQVCKSPINSPRY